MVVPCSFQASEHFHNLGGLRRVQVACRLVSQQQCGLVNNCPRNADELLLTAGELVRVKVFFGDDREAVQNVSDHRLPLGLRQVFIGQGKIDILSNGKVVEQVIALKHHASTLASQVSPLLTIERVYGFFLEPVFPSPLVIKQSQNIQQRRFART